MKIILAGPPRSGKSCLREGLKNAIHSITKHEPYCYVLTACPDGEGAWFQETAFWDPALAKKCKDEYRSQFTPEFVALWAGHVRSPNLPPLTLVDIGGLVSEENRQICAAATHAILLAREQSQFAEWDQFADELGVKVLARLISDYRGQEDWYELMATGELVGTVHYLERGQPTQDRPTIQQLARMLVESVQV